MFGKSIEITDDLINKIPQTASPEVQVKYLSKVIKLQNQKIIDMELEIKSLKLETELEGNKLFHQIETLNQVRKDILSQKSFLTKSIKKKPWWRFGKNETRN